jgi:hypothetical protein
LSFLFNVSAPVRAQATHPESPTKPAGITASTTAPADASIRFSYQPIDFQLETDETPERHAPETMAGGVAVFDYNNDGKLDIFFTNGADIHTLRKSSPNSATVFLKMTARDISPTSLKKPAPPTAATTWAWPSATMTMMATQIFLSPASTATLSITTTETAPSPTSPQKPGSTSPTPNTDR